MIKKLIFFCLCVGFAFVSTSSGQSGIVGFTTVAFDDEDQIVGGISETYLTYDIAYYYDAGADGLLSYQNPYEPIDGDIGEGINDTYFDLQFGLMYGIEVDYTTNDYRRNKIACADTIHYVRLVYQPPIPFAPEPYYDPYQLAPITPGTYENSFSITTQNSPTESYSAGEVEIVGYTYACIRTPTVGSVVFEEVSSPISANPAVDLGNGVILGGGERIFANRRTPDDSINRRTIRVRARLATSGGTPTFTSGVKIYFRSFDVDDPATNGDIDENGSAGDDNRDERFIGSPYPASARGTFSDCSLTTNGCFGVTDSNGEATAVFQVSRQPGDNFVIAASTDEDYVIEISGDGTGLKDSLNQALPTERAKRSPLLTVWVKVHVEVDSMGPIGNNLVAGTTRSRGTVGATPVWLNVSPSTATLEPGRFQGGRMKYGPHNFYVLDNTATAVQVQNNSGNVTVTLNALFQLFDDDDFNDTDGPPLGDGTLDGDDGEDVTFRGATMFEETFSRLQPSADINENPYTAAYIEPDYSWAENQTDMNDSNVQFETVAYSEPGFINERVVVDRFRDSAAMENDEFWIGYILIGYQTNINDGDPGSEDIVGGTAPPVNYMTAWTNEVIDSRDVTRGSVGAIVYIEQMRDSDVNDATDFRVRSVPHELGHQFGLAGDTQSGFGIMSVEDPLLFVPRHINIMRWRQASPGEE